jgi:DNA repair protein RadC
MNLDQSLSLPASPSPMFGPRERAESEGIAALGDSDLLAIILGTGIAGRPVTLVAAALLDGFGGSAGLARSGPASIAQHPGVGMTKAMRIAAALELGARSVRPAGTPVTVSTSAEVAAYMGPRIGRLVHEEMWLLCLDGRNRIRAARKVAQGGLHSLIVSPRDVMRAAVHEAASSVVLVHNHPGGDSSPSPEDLVITRKVADAGRVLGTPLVDHVILTPEGRSSSLLDMGVLDAI